MLAGGPKRPFPGRRALPVPARATPVLMVVVDTEEEFDHQAPFDVHASTENVGLQTLAQAVLERHGVVPTYVIDYPVAQSEEAARVLLPLLREERCDIGAHLHPWVNPPDAGPVDEAASYPGNLSRESERAKLACLTEVITERFGKRPVIYKAGRYGVGPATGEILAELGYTIDVSVVPRTDFSMRYGPDFNDFDDTPISIDERLIGLPLSVGFVGALAMVGPTVFPRLNGTLGRRLRLPAFASRLGLLERLRLTPEGHSLRDMQRQTRAGVARGKRLFMLTYHSSSLLPGANPYVRTRAQRDAFLDVLDHYLHFFRNEIGGRAETVAEVGRSILNALPEIGPAPRGAARPAWPALVDSNHRPTA